MTSLFRETVKSIVLSGWSLQAPRDHTVNHLFLMVPASTHSLSRWPLWLILQFQETVKSIVLSGWSLQAPTA